MKYIDIFLKHLKNQNYSNKTLKDYSYILKNFQKYLNTIHISDEKNVNENHFKDYITKYKNSNNHSIYYITVIIVKKYFRFLVESDFIFISPIERIKNPKQVVKHHPIIQKNEIIDILNNFQHENSSDIRTRAILELLYSSALRPGESLNLNISNIDFDNRMILIKKTKTKTDRIVPVTKEALFWINEYFKNVRIKFVGKKDCGKIFLSFHTGKQITLKGLNNSLSYSYSKKNIKHFSLYSIRATSVTHLFENGMSINHIKILLGHKDLRITQIYVRIDFIKLKETLKKYHPRNKLEQKGNTENEIYKTF